MPRTPLRAAPLLLPLALATGRLAAQTPADTLRPVPPAPTPAPATKPAPAPGRRPGSVYVDSRGVVFAAPDSAAEIIMRFRMQLLATGESSDGNTTAFNGTVRRLRLRFGGWVIDPKLMFNLQLSFTRGDQDFADTGFPNIVRDAAVLYQATPNLRLTFGQTKLPGNRQRVISSADLQTAERSIVNNRFNIDRDFLLMASLRDTVGGRVPMYLTGAVSGGEGRNSAITAPGLAVTGRAEIQPFGAFTRGGDDFEGDLEHEPTPKLALGVSWSRNQSARRTGGQLGLPLYAPRTMTTVLADALLKYRGLAVYSEYADRSAADPITRSTGQPDRAIYVGSGEMLQASYHFRRVQLEPVVRWARTRPDAVLAGVVNTERQEQVAFGVAKYLRRHRVKTQAEFGWLDSRNEATLAERRTWIGRLNMELGI